MNGASSRCGLVTRGAPRRKHVINIALVSLNGIVFCGNWKYTSSQAEKVAAMAPASRILSSGLACSLAILFAVGCVPKRTAVPVALAAERRVALDSRNSGRVGHADIYPDLSITPGVAASDVRQENVRTTICVSGFTQPPRRPPSSYTDPLKVKGFDEYGLPDRKKGDYEEDHLISLELGGESKGPEKLVAGTVQSIDTRWRRTLQRQRRKLPESSDLPRQNDTGRSTKIDRHGLVSGV